MMHYGIIGQWGDLESKVRAVHIYLSDSPLSGLCLHSQNGGGRVLTEERPEERRLCRLCLRREDRLNRAGLYWCESMAGSSGVDEPLPGAEALALAVSMSTATGKVMALVPEARESARAAFIVYQTQVYEVRE